jgi:signal transduction histidine kinase
VSDYLAERLQRRPARGAGNERRWLAITFLAACTALVMLAVAAAPYPERGERIPMALVAGCLIVLLRRWPSPMLAVTAAAVGMVTAAGNASLPFGLMLGTAMYLTASKLPRRTSIRAAVTVVAVLAAGLLYSWLALPHPPLALAAVVGYSPLAAGWFVGDSVAARRRYLAGLAEQAERERAAEAERARQQTVDERVRIARELHDVVAHTLAVITVQAGVGRRLMAKRPEEASSALESIEAIGRTAQDELRVVLGLLRDEEIGPAALAPAPRLVDVKELAQTVRASGTPVELRTSGTDSQLSPALELSIYRVVQEALTNVVKHAPGASATVDLEVSDRAVRIEVTDDGGAAGQPSGGAAGPGHGIVGMRERTGAFGGWLVAEPLAGRGWHVLAEIPLDGAA